LSDLFTDPGVRWIPEWAKRLTARDKKALTALIWAHINPYGTFHIDMNTHLDLGPGTPTAKAA
jgi:hypothetical protein